MWSAAAEMWIWASLTHISSCCFQAHNNKPEQLWAKIESPACSVQILNQSITSLPSGQNLNLNIQQTYDFTNTCFYILYNPAESADFKKGHGVTYGCVLRARRYDVFKEGIPLDIQHISLVAAHFWVMRLQAAGLKQRQK